MSTGLTFGTISLLYGLNAGIITRDQCSVLVTVIVEAREGKYDLLVTGFVGHSNVFGRVMGSTTQNLSRLSPCSVLRVK